MTLKTRRIRQLANCRTSVRQLLSAKDQGLTLIECLVAIAVIALSTAAITPAVVLSVATRVQSQRAEQAFQVAQAEVDRIKLVVEQGGNYELNIAQAATGVDSLDDFETLVPPPDNVDRDLDAYSTAGGISEAKPVEVRGNEYAVQIFRTVSNNTGTSPQAFDLGVRVYRADVVDEKDAADLGTEQASLRFTSGEGESGSRPLAVIYTSIIKSDLEDSLCNYHDFIDSVQGTTTSTPFGC